MKYTMGFDFCDSIKRSGASYVLRVPYLELIIKYGLVQAMNEIKNSLINHEIEVLVFSLDNCFDFPPDFFNLIKKKIYCCLYLGDDEHYFERSARYYAQSFDLALPSNPLSVKRYLMYDIDSLMFPSCFDINTFSDISFIDCEDVVFVGKASGKVGRKSYLKSLEMSEINFSSYGSSSSNQVVSREKMYSLFHSAKISLNFTGVSISTPLDSDISINRRIRGVKGRCQEIALCGGFVLTEYVPGIEELFEIGSEIDTFNSTKEMMEKINYYLNNSSIRQQMSKKAYLRAIKEYSDVYVWNKIGKYISIQEKNRKNIIYIDDIFNKSYSAYQFSRMLGLLFKLRIDIFINDFALLFTLKRPNIKLFIYYLKVDFVNTLMHHMQKFNNLNQKINKCLKR